MLRLCPRLSWCSLLDAHHLLRSSCCRDLSRGGRSDYWAELGGGLNLLLVDLDLQLLLLLVKDW